MPDRARLGAGLGLAASLAWVAGLGGMTGAAVLGAGCTPHACDGTYETFDAGVANMRPEVPGEPGGAWVFESSPLQGPWVHFPGGLQIGVTYPPGFTSANAPVGWVSTDPTQTGGATSTTSSGQLDEFSNLRPNPDGGMGGFQLRNASCADYYVYFAVVGSYVPPGTGDSGTAEAAAQDAAGAESGGDAGADALRD